MRESIKAYIEDDRLLRGVAGAVAWFLIITISIWWPVLEWCLDIRDRYRDWRGGRGC